MIIKLGHVSYACAIRDIDNVKNSFHGYSEVFRQKLENLDIKADYCNIFSTGHELLLLSPQDTSLLPVELTAYNEVFLQERLFWVEDNTIHINTSAIADSANFFKTLGFKSTSDNELCLPCIFDPKKVYIKLHMSQTINKWKLDSDGWCCIAFLCDSAERQRAKLMDKIRCTPIQQLIVNGKPLNIFFAQGTQGELVEFYSL